MIFIAIYFLKMCLIFVSSVDSFGIRNMEKIMIQILTCGHRWSSPTVITFFPISEFSYRLIRFLLNSSIVKSDNEIGKFSY